MPRSDSVFVSFAGGTTIGPPAFPPFSCAPVAFGISASKGQFLRVFFGHFDPRYKGEGDRRKEERGRGAATVGVLGGNIGLNPMNINKKEIKICHFLLNFLMILALC